MTRMIEHEHRGAVRQGSPTPAAPPQPRASPSDRHGPIVRDTFADGFSAGSPSASWFHVRAGDYRADDGIATAVRDGLRIVSGGTNARTGESAFGISLAPERVNGGIPATNDHAKWLAYMSHRSSAGLPGFDAVDGLELIGSTRIAGRTFGTHLHPFGHAVANPDEDLRLAAFAMTTIDIESFMVFDFFFTNARVYAFYERLPFGRTATNPYASFSYAIPVASRTIDAAHDVSIAYDRSAGVARWILDGREVYRVSRIGHRLPGREHMLIDLGGVEQSVAPRQLDFGMGLFTLLDGAIGAGPGLVRLSSALPYYAPATGVPEALPFVDQHSRPGSRLFGQGAELVIGAYEVTYAARALGQPPRAGRAP